MSFDSAIIAFTRQAQTLDYLCGFSLGREGNTEGRLPVRGMSVFAVEGVDFGTVFAVHSSLNDPVVGVCCQLH